MTPEERQQQIDFIIQSQANSTVRMDRFDEELARQKDNIEGLMRLAQQLLEVARVERDTRKAEIEAEREARKAQFEAEREARKAEIEAERAKIHSLDEMTKVLRELLEANLRRPEEPPQPQT